MDTSSTIITAIKKVNTAGIIASDDVLAREEPLEIRIMYGPETARIQKNISITMRTPGNDPELAAGFLFTEGIISSFIDISSITSNENNITIITTPEVKLQLHKLERHFYTTSSCGVCGKSSIDAVRTICSFPSTDDSLTYPAELIYKLPDMLRKRQDVFESTGGLHASALFDTGGDLLLLREDVGRHNALDKLIGVALENGMLPLDKYLLLLSGRASFELIQKAMMAGIKMVAAVGAPSSLAVEMAKESGMTLIGFLRDQRFNIYAGEQRVII